MSRVGRQPITVAEGIKVTVKDGIVTVTGPKGELTQEILPEVTIKMDGNILYVERNGETKKHRSYHGLYRALINNMIRGVSQGFQRELEMQGVGYTAELKGRNLLLHVGYSHPILFKPPEEITFDVPSRTEITVRGISKRLVGEVAAKIRSFRPPEPYKGKGIRYVGEEVRRKVGKTSA